MFNLPSWMAWAISLASLIAAAVAVWRRKAKPAVVPVQPVQPVPPPLSDVDVLADQKNKAIDDARQQQALEQQALEQQQAQQTADLSQRPPEEVAEWLKQQGQNVRGK